MMSLVGDRVGVLREIGICDGIVFFSDAHFFLSGKINLSVRLFQTAGGKPKEAYENTTPKFLECHCSTSGSDRLAPSQPLRKNADPRTRSGLSLE